MLAWQRVVLHAVGTELNRMALSPDLSSHKFSNELKTVLFNDALRSLMTSVGFNISALIQICIRDLFDPKRKET